MISMNLVAAMMTIVLVVSAETATAQGREEVFYLQTKIDSLGYDIGKPDGVAGKRTINALREIGAEEGFEPTPAAAVSHYMSKYYATIEEIPEDGEDMKHVKETFEDVLLDPFSARFKDIVMTDNGNVCGLVNSKNSYGAYAGFRWFFGPAVPTTLLRDRSFFMITPIVDSDESRRAEYFCMFDVKMGKN